MSVPLKNSGQKVAGGFFSDAIQNRIALVPGAASLVAFANKPLGTGAAREYNARVKSSQQNGAGPAIAPITAPWSFTQFATGKRTLVAAIQKKFKK